MANARKVVIEFVGNDKSLSSTADKAERKMGGLGSKLKSVGKFAATGLAAGAVVAGAALFKMGQAAAEDAAGAARLAKTLKNTTGATDAQIAATEDWITAQGKALGVSDDELRPAMEKLVRATGDVGEAQKLASLAMDISAGSGQSLESVSKALMKAQNGQVAGLSKLGIETKDAEGKTISFDQATDRLGKTFKGSAQANADTLQGKIGRLKLILGETGEEIGAKLIPVVTRMADWFLNKGLPALKKFGAYLQVNLPPIIDKIRSTFESLRAPVKAYYEELWSMTQTVLETVRVIWDKFGKNITQMLVSTFKNAAQVLSGAFQVIRGLFKIVGSLLKGDWKGVWEGIKTVLRGAVKIVIGLVKQLWTLVKYAFKNAGVALKAIFGGIWSGIKTLARNGINGIVDLIRGLPGKFANLHRSFGRAGVALLQSFIDGMKNAAGIISGIAGNVWNAVKGLINGAISKINSALEFTIDLPGPKNLPVNIANIPHLAKGGVVRARNGGTLALLGEAGHDEAVVPLSGPHAPRGGPGSTGGGEQIVVILQLDGKEIHRSLLKRQRTTGSLGLA